MGSNFTTLIFGAGTSLDYGYPSGEALVEEIKIKAKSSATGPERQLYSDLSDHMPLSIDAFLKALPVHDALAKALIAETLYDREDPEIERKSSDFYRHIFLNIPKEKFSDFKVITFNYDRSLEYFWARHLKPLLSNA